MTKTGHVYGAKINSILAEINITLREVLMLKTVENIPLPNVLMNSMRAMGYSFEAAVADVLDNSIAAKASLIEIKFPIDPIDCYIAICDNGWGMSRDKLIEAMKYGSQEPNDEREEHDLGRFGLGLKSASLSQCKKLTVFSKKEGVISAFRWDLDIINEKKEWLMIECSSEEVLSNSFIHFLDDKKCGTIVLWENFDIIEKSSNGNIYAELKRLQDSTSEYISLIFHRFLNRDGLGKVTIKVNNYEIKGLDPFLENHKKTNIRKKIEIPIPDSNGVERYVSVQPFVLPFQKDLSAEDKKMSGGIENYRSKQGFYIYRNERLIIWGKWFGRHQDELTKYARVKVDIPNTLDDIWNIDIKKQNATIPSSIRTRLTRAVDEAMDVAVKAQTYRGRVAKIDDKIDYIWDRIEGRAQQFSYRINRDSKIFDIIKTHVDDEIWSYIDMVLEEVEKAIPYQQIYIDKSQNKIDEEYTEQQVAEIKSKAEMLILMAKSIGNTDVQGVINSLFNSEPFCKCPALKEELIEEFL